MLFIRKVRILQACQLFCRPPGFAKRIDIYIYIYVYIYIYIYIYPAASGHKPSRISVLAFCIQPSGSTLSLLHSTLKLLASSL